MVVVPRAEKRHFFALPPLCRKGEFVTIHGLERTLSEKEIGNDRRGGPSGH